MGMAITEEERAAQRIHEAVDDLNAALKYARSLHVLAGIRVQTLADYEWAEPTHSVFCDTVRVLGRPGHRVGT